jgi:hypothetical protein
VKLSVKKLSITITAVLFIALTCLPAVIMPSKLSADTAYDVGDTGPAGGNIFYSDGLNYLEAAPNDFQSFYNWQEALTACDEFVKGGYDDWFLPSIDQLELMYENLPLPPNFDSEYSYYWSSTETDPEYAELLNFNTGMIHIWPKDINYDQAWAVRTFKTVNKPKNIEPIEKSWVRDHEITCSQVWINEDNNFEFIFWWEYANNNWVKAYNMEGNEVFSIDMQYGNTTFVMDLPDGVYTVKTFHDKPEPIQIFAIGKP